MFYASAKSGTRAAMLATATLLASPAFAHDGSAHTGGLTAGLLHPLMGPDHILAMLAIGIWAAQCKGGIRWSTLFAFPIVMALGAILAISGVRLPGIESGIAGSVAVLGLLIAFAVRMPAWASAAVVSLFGLVHGVAHGMELPADASPVLFGVGFMLATLVLQAIGLKLARIGVAPVARMLGAAIAVAGGYLLVGIG